MENIDIKRCLQILLGKLEMEEDKIRILFVGWLNWSRNWTS